MNLGILETILREGFIYGILAMGVYITYKILDFPDLSVEGTFPLGACLCASLIAAGVPAWIALLCSLCAGAIAGMITGLLHVRLKISDLLSGILVMTALWSVNLIVTGGTAIKQFFGLPTIFISLPASLLPERMGFSRKLYVIIVLVLLIKLVLDWFLQTKLGLILRAEGDNDSFVTGLGVDSGKIRIFGLSIGNALAALSGGILAQVSENADINMGKGIVVLALASVILGSTLLGKTKLKPTTIAVAGALLYKLCLQVALLLKLPSNYLKLLMAVLLTGAILLDRVKSRKEARS
ncbi:MAG: ABC transporter permease [Erysipelotrichales bacterium]|nr:ABC transporter permease [Erysipelotrichales bacterium]